jgi:GNAT superfamily N-acetyltransferase
LADERAMSKLDGARYDEVMDAYGADGAPLYVGATGSERHAGKAWFALVSGQASGELNVCAIGPGAPADAAERIVAALGDLPAIISVAPAAEPASAPALAAAGFERADTAEPIMFCERLPAARETPFRTGIADGDAIDRVTATISEAHGLQQSLVDLVVGRALRAGEVAAWVAWDGDEVASTVTVTPGDRLIGVHEMMTPPRHRRRGAGRAVLHAALRELWRPATAGAYLLSTPAGRPLYEAFGFHALAESKTWVRGGDPAVLAAIGQVG